MLSSTGALSSLRHRNFRLLFAANLTSNIGSWAQRVAQDWLILELTHSPRDLGIVTGLQFLPSLLLSVHGGLLADRVSKRKLLILTSVLSCSSSLLLGTLVVTGAVRVWHVMALALALGVFGALEAPARQTFNSELVGPDELRNAVSLNAANFNAGRLIGPAVSGFLIAKFHTGPSFFIDATSYVFVITALLMMRDSELHIDAKKVSTGTIREAVGYVRARPDIMGVMLTMFFVATFGLNFQMFNALMATTVFGKGPAEFGGLGSFVALGSLSGSIISARLNRKHGPRFIMLFGVFFGAGVILLSQSPSYLVYSCYLPISGAMALTTMISANTYVQTTTEPHIRGRVMGLYLMLVFGGTPVGAVLLGWTSTHFGIRDAMLGFGIITGLGVVITYVVLRSKMKTPAMHWHHPPEFLTSSH